MLPPDMLPKPDGLNTRKGCLLFIKVSVSWRAILKSAVRTMMVWLFGWSTSGGNVRAILVS
jgi:hypothetical protein